MSWQSLVDKLSYKWKHVRIRPLIPDIWDNWPGTLAAGAAGAAGDARAAGAAGAAGARHYDWWLSVMVTQWALLTHGRCCRLS
jgi:hypothetical protein